MTSRAPNLYILNIGDASHPIRTDDLNAITGMEPNNFRHLARHGKGLDYWDGEA
jgi:hypothetical protein